MGPIIAFSSFALVALSAPLEVSLAWVLPDRAVYAGETIPLSLGITVPEAWLDGNLLQLFPQPLDLPLQVRGFEGLGSGRLTPVERQDDGATQSVVVDGTISHAVGPVISEGTNGRVASFTVRRWFKVQRPGTIQLPGAGAHYAYAESFRDDFVQGRVPVDRQTADAAGTAQALEVLAPPEDGRPFEFTGVVGPYHLTAQRAQSSVRVGEAVKVILRMRASDGRPHPTIEPRDIQVEESSVFVELGRTATTSEGETTIDISFGARSAGFHELPAASLTVFDPTLSPPAYRVARAPGPGVQVRPAEGASESAVPPAGSSPSIPAEEPNPKPYWTMAVGAFVFALAVASVIRRRIL